MISARTLVIIIFLLNFMAVDLTEAARPSRSVTHRQPQVSPPKKAKTSSPTPASTLPVEVPVSQGTMKNLKPLIKEFDGWLDAVEQSGKVAGLAVAIVKDDQILLQRGIGYANASTKTRITPTTVFRLASLSKGFASTLTALLVKDGVLSWEDRVADFLPTFALQDETAAQQLTVRDILSQRVGLPHNTYDKELESDEPYPLLVDKLKQVSLTCPVGNCYAYQNISFSLIGDVVYAATGDFFYHQVEKRLFHPLGMSTATYGKAALESSSQWARPHSRRGKDWVPFHPKESYYRVPPAAGVNANIKDMSQWLIAQMGGRPAVLPQELLTALHKPQISTPKENKTTPWRRGRIKEASYAHGWRVYDYAGETLIFHGGAVQGYRAMIGFFPQYRFGIVMLWNCESALPSGLMPMLFDRYLKLPTVDWAGVETISSGEVSRSGDE